MNIITASNERATASRWARWLTVTAITLLIMQCAIVTPIALGKDMVSYRVTGEISIRTIDSDAAERDVFVPLEPPVWVYTFDVSVSGCSWRIHATPTLQPTPPEDLQLPGGSVGAPATWELVMASNGEEFCRFKTGPRRSAASAYEAYRGSGPAPFGVERELAVLWYAYASGCATAEGQNDIVPLETLSIEAFASSNNRIPGRIKKSNLAPFLPLTVATTGYAFEPSASDWRITAPGHFTNAVYRVSTTTNSFGITVPLHALVQYFAINKSGDHFTRKPSYVMAVDTHSISSSDSPLAYPPALDGKYLVKDYRSIDRRGGGVTMIVSSNKWPESSVVRSASVGRNGSNSSAWHRILPISAIVAVMVAPLLRLLAARKSKP